MRFTTAVPALALLAAASALSAEHRAPLMADAPEPHPIVEAMKELSPDDLSPREALEALYKLKGLVDNNE